MFPFLLHPLYSPTLLHTTLLRYCYLHCLPSRLALPAGGIVSSHVPPFVHLTPHRARCADSHINRHSSSSPQTPACSHRLVLVFLFLNFTTFIIFVYIVTNYQFTTLLRFSMFYVILFMYCTIYVCLHLTSRHVPPPFHLSTSPHAIHVHPTLLSFLLHVRSHMSLFLSLYARSHRQSMVPPRQTTCYLLVLILQHNRTCPGSTCLLFSVLAVCRVLFT